MFQKPTAAKQLYFDVIPRTVDDYLGFLEAYPLQTWKERLGNPVWHIHSGDAAEARSPRRHDGSRPAPQFPLLCCSILQTVSNDRKPVSSLGVPFAGISFGSPHTHPSLDSLVRYAVAYFRDFVAPKKRYRAADDVDVACLADFIRNLRTCPQTSVQTRSSARSTMSPGPFRDIRTTRQRGQRRRGLECQTNFSI